VKILHEVCLEDREISSIQVAHQSFSISQVPLIFSYLNLSLNFCSTLYLSIFKNLLCYIWSYCYASIVVLLKESLIQSYYNIIMTIKSKNDIYY